MRRAAVILIIFMGACGGSSGQKCITGASVSCACSDGHTGAQVCLPDGTYGLCMCGAGVDGGGSDAAGTGSGGSGQTGTGGSGAGGSVLTGTGGAGGGSTDARADGGAPPMMGAGSRLVVSGGTQGPYLVGAGPNSCTNQPGATGDRWCAFASLNTISRAVDLFVINVSQAAAGTAISCEGTDPNCARLTTNLYVDALDDISIHGFDGDTLIYYAEVGAGFVPATFDPVTGGVLDPGTGFVGPVYGWRPGMTGGRKLTSDTGVFCTGHPRNANVVCFDNRDQTTVTTQVTYDLHAGTLSATSAVMPKIETVLFATSTDMQGVTKFEFDMSPDGNYVAWSARPTATGVETLKVLQLGASAPTTVAPNVSRWLISADGTRWYWLSGYNYNTAGAASGTLQMAPFPAGTGPTLLAANVADYDNAGNGVIFRDAVTGGRGNLKMIVDRANPTAVTLDTGVAGVVDISADGSRAIYVRTVDSTNGTVDLYVGSSAGMSGRCTLIATATAAPFTGLLATGSGAVWARLQTNGDLDGMFTSVATCASAKFANNIFGWQVIGDQGYIYGDEFSVDGDMTLRHSKPTGTTLPTGTSVQTRATPVYAPLLPGLPAVVYTVNTGLTGDGLYINATLPFTTN